MVQNYIFMSNLPPNVFFHLELIYYNVQPFIRKSLGDFYPLEFTEIICPQLIAKDKYNTHLFTPRLKLHQG